MACEINHGFPVSQAGPERKPGRDGNFLTPAFLSGSYGGGYREHHSLHDPARLGKIVKRTAKRSRLILRPIHLDRLEEELKIVHEVYNCTLERNWGAVPISMDDLLSAADDMRAFADPGMILIAEMNGENAGIALSLPNFNEKSLVA